MDVFGIPGAIVVQGGAVGLLFLFVIALLVGRLIPIATHIREIDQANKQIENYKAAWEASEKRADAQAQQIGEILNVLKTPKEG